MVSKYFKPPSINAYISTRNKVAARTIRKDYLLIGRQANCQYESILLWDLATIPYDMDIICATANFFIAYNNSPCSKVIEAYPILSRWKLCTTSWRHRPLTRDTPASSTTIADTTEQLSLDITALVKAWQSCKSSNCGLLLKVRESGSDNELALFSGNCRDSSYWPFIQIDYAPPDVVPCIYKPDTINVSVKVRTTDNWSYTKTADLLPYNYSYIISNTGSNPAIVYLSGSADNDYWLEQSATHVLCPSESTACTPNIATRFARLAFRSLNPCQSTTLRISIQGRTTI